MPTCPGAGSDGTSVLIISRGALCSGQATPTPAQAPPLWLCGSPPGYCMMAASPCHWCCCLQTCSLPWWNLWPSQPGPLTLPALSVPSVSFWFYFLCDSAPSVLELGNRYLLGLGVETSQDGWLRPCLPMQGMWIWSLLRELNSHPLHGQKNQNIKQKQTNKQKQKQKCSKFKKDFKNGLHHTHKIFLIKKKKELKPLWPGLLF